MIRLATARPALDLRVHVRRYHQCEVVGGEPRIVSTTPAGRPALVFSLDHPHEAAIGTAPLTRQPRVTVRGVCTAPVRHRFAPERRWFMIVLRATGLRSLLGIAGPTVADSQIDASSVGAAAATVLAELADRLRDAADFSTRCELASTGLRRIGATPSHPALALVAGAVERIDATAGTVGMQGLADQLHVSPRTLHRRFVETVGLPPKTFAAVTRFGRVVRDLHRRQGRDWLDLVHRYGYADQSHLGREFRRFAGRRPSDYRPAEEALDRELHALASRQSPGLY
jgi:methylphosphotriester-DNA--protein-cysteine methyltransferase